MFRPLDDFIAWPGFDRPAHVHHQRVFGEVPCAGNVVCDEQGRQPLLVFQQQIQHVQADRHVQHGNRLVGQQDVRLDRQRTSDSDTLALSAASRGAAGVLLTLVAVEYGGWFMLLVVRGRHPATPFQLSFFRAGHAHAGVLVILALVGQILVDATHLSGVVEVFARNGIWAAAILMPAGFFLSAAGKGVTKPNRLIVLLYVGVVSLADGVLVLGIGLLAA